MSTSFSRREFLQVLAGAAGVALVGAGCTGDKGGNTTPLATRNNDGTFTVKGGGNLQPNTAMGFLLPTASGSDEAAPAIIFTVEKDKLQALSARCTHAGCTVSWEQESGTHILVCPCHGSRFATNGQVLNGPAKKPLASYTVRKSGEDAIITVKA